MTSALDSGEQEEVLDFLSGGSAFGVASPPERIDTHAASVFLAGDRAWKLKRAVQFDYLDFSTADRRRDALEAEIRLNRRTAPSLYRAVHPIMRDAKGRLAIEGEGQPVDWVLEMQRFPDDCLFEHLAERGRLDTALLMRLVDRLVAFHAGTDVLQRVNGAAIFQRIIDGNASSMAAFPALLDQHSVRRLVDRLTRLRDDAAQLLDSRARAGRIRHGHGDLHLGNIALVDGEPTPFDCLEFNAELASVDLLYDLAFLLMDLWRRGLRNEANLVFNRYIDLSPQDEDGVALMPLFLATRAAIRAHVLAARSERTGDPTAGREAGTFLDLALELTEPVSPCLVAIGGLSGTGKSTLARTLGSAIGRAPGARVVRSDVLRKQLAGYPPETPLSRDRYSAEADARVYALLARRVAAALAAGQAAIADAVFARAGDRAALEQVATGVPFIGLWLEAPIKERITRLFERPIDASDADEGVARAQTSIDVGELRGWHIIAAAGEFHQVAATARTLLGRSGAEGNLSDRSRRIRCRANRGSR